MQLLTFSDGVVKIDSVAIDGILTGLSINGEVLFDNQSRDGLSGTVKQPMGWSDMDVTLNMDLLTDDVATCYERLAKINSVFRAREYAPQVFEVSNRHLSARGVREVYFAQLSSAETDQDDVISVSLSFIEYIPIVVKAEKGEQAIGNTTSQPKNEAGKPIPEDFTLKFEMD